MSVPFSYLAAVCRALSPKLRRVTDPTPKQLVERWVKHFEHAYNQNKAPQAVADDLYSKHIRNEQAKLAKELKKQNGGQP